MENYLPLILGLLIAAAIIWWLIKKLAMQIGALIANSLMGMIVIFIANRLLEWSIPLNLPVLMVCAVFGLPGAGSIMLLYYFGMLGSGPAPLI